MRLLLLLAINCCLFFSCKDENNSNNNDELTDTETELANSNQTDGLVMLGGDFVYYADAAVLQATNGSMYGVVINQKMHQLADSVAQYKKEAYDFVPVVVRGKIIPKDEDEEGWPFKIDIKEIVSIKPPSPEKNDIIKLESNK